MTTKEPDQQQQPGQNDPTLIEAVTGPTVEVNSIVDTQVHDASVENSIAAPAAAVDHSVDTTGLNSLSEAAMKGIGTGGGSNNINNYSTNIPGISEEYKATIAQVEQVKQQAIDAIMATAAAATETTRQNESKIDMVLTKLDTILERLNRIEAMVPMDRSSPTKPIIRQTRPRVKNTCPSMMKTLQGAPIHEMNLHFYDNEYHVLPEGWVLPRLSFEGLVQFWFLGDTSAGVPPLIKVGGTEFKNLPRGVRKRSDMKYLMKHVERKGRELGCYIDNIDDWTIESVRNLYARTKQCFEYPNKSSAQTKFDKLSWETVCHNLRRNKGVLLGEDPNMGTEEVEDRGTGAVAQNHIHVVNEVSPDVGRALIDEMESPIPIAAPETPGDTPNGVPIAPPESVALGTNDVKDQDNDVVMESTNSTVPSEEPKGDGACSV